MEKEIVKDYKGPIVFFDGVCGLCNFFVDFVITRDKKALFKFAPLQGDSAKTKDISLVQYNSVVLYMDGEYFIKSSAAIKILAELGGIYSLLKILLIIPDFMRNAVYDLIAANRYKWFGKRETCRIPGPEERERFLP